MVKANCKLYPLPIIPRDTLQDISPKLKKLEEKTNTTIVYNFEERYFDINGIHKEACDKAELIIRQALLPHLNQSIEASYMLGTFEDLSILKKEMPISNESPVLPVNVVHQIQGQPLLPKHEMEQEESPFEEYELPVKDEDADNGEIVNQTFTISPLVRNIKDFLTGPPQRSMRLGDYLNLVSKSTNAACSLNGRNVRITGTIQAVQLAYDKFSVIQKTHIGQSKKILVSCVHYPQESGHYGLYFCDLQFYRHKSFVHTLNLKTPRLFVLLPVFPDPTTNEYRKPKDLNHVPRVTPPPPPQLYNMDIPFCSMNQKSNQFEPSLWGMDRDFKSVYNTVDLEYLCSERLAKAFTPPPPLPLDRPVPMLQDFPTLESSPSPACQKSSAFKPVQSPNKAEARRVLRIIPQESSPITPRPGLSLLNRVREYNYYNIKTALSQGLESVRGFLGEIRLSAKLGKVVWTNVKPEVYGKIWAFEDMNDIVIRELCTWPSFTKTTNDADIISLMDSSINSPQKRFMNKTAIFEFHCSARNQPHIDYKPVVLHMNQGVINVGKVVISENVVAEVDWISLDRKYDFQLTLTTKQLVRRDVKPYTSFIKWVSVCPITHRMSFENVPNFLNVNCIIFKQTTRYKMFPFIIEITQSEMVLMEPVKNSKKINANPGRGETWYDLQVYNMMHDAPFQENLELELGTEASWTVEDILQLNSAGSDMIIDYVQCMLSLIEKIEAAIKREGK